MAPVLSRYNSLGDLYPLHAAPTSTLHAMLTSVDLWHRRLGHPINKLCHLYFKNLASLVLPLMILLFVMHVNAANMFDYRLEPPQLLDLFLLNYSIVICGHLL
jgi:hypothetical protein